MFAVGKNVLVRVPKNKEEKVGSIFIPGYHNGQVTGIIESVGRGITDERLQKNKMIIAIDASGYMVNNGLGSINMIVKEDKEFNIVAINYDSIIAVEE